jgi:UDP-galactopyranose mutase
MHGLNLNSSELDDFFASKAEPAREIRTSEHVVVNKIGPEPYKKFFKGNTLKQWGMNPSELNAYLPAQLMNTLITVLVNYPIVHLNSSLKRMIRRFSSKLEQ